MQAIITLTDNAKAEVLAILEKGGQSSLRIGVKKGGCSGFSYSMDYTNEVKKYDEVIDLGDGKSIIVDPKATIYLLGTTMDFKDEIEKTGFIFTNPNEKGKCGCGESVNF
jgi:iron-sulfur cluster assembly protein